MPEMVSEGEMWPRILELGWLSVHAYDGILWVAVSAYSFPSTTPLQLMFIATSNVGCARIAGVHSTV